MINEELAKRAKEANSFSDYVKGSATSEFNAEINEVRAIAEDKKKNIPAEHHKGIDNLVERYTKRLAEWTNRYNANSASCPSIMICGAGNFPVSKKAKQNAREERLWEEYEKIQNLKHRITYYRHTIKNGDKNAITELKAKLERAIKLQEDMKEANAYYRKNKSMKGFRDLTDEGAERWDNEIKNGYSWQQVPYPSYTLTNNNSKIKSTRDRIAMLESEKSQGNKEIETKLFRVKENTEIMRLQVFFDNIPSEEMRCLLKSSGFKWSPKNKAWQRQLTNNARYALRKLIEKLD